MKNLIIGVFVTLLLGACSSTQPTPPRENVAIQSQTWQLETKLVNLRQSPEVLTFLQEVLVQNYDLKSTAASVQAANTSVAIQDSATQPQVGANLTSERNKDSATNATSANLNVNWALDIWGKLADETEASKLYAQQQEQTYLYAKRALLAEALNAWTDFWQLDQQLANLKTQHQIAQALMSAEQEAYRDGTGSYDQYIALQNSLRELEITQENARLQKQQTLHLLNILRGREPTAAFEAGSSPSVFLVEIPYTFDSRAILDRPDVQAAYSGLKMLDTQTQAAHKALLPQVTLSGTLMRSGSSLKNLLTGETLWQLVGGFSQSIWSGGELEAMAKQKSEEAESAFWSYRQTVLKALQEVEDALARERSLKQQLLLQQRTESNHQKQLESAKERYTSGQILLAEYQEMHSAYLQTELAVQNLQADLIRNRINLALALGYPLESILK